MNGQLIAPPPSRLRKPGSIAVNTGALSVCRSGRPLSCTPEKSFPGHFISASGVVTVQLHSWVEGRQMGRPTISELESILDAEEDVPIEILPNGEIRAHGKGSSELSGRKPLTMRENLGGEYGGGDGSQPHP